MALEVEDGTGKANAESYVSLAAATARHSALGNSAWADAADDTTREQALRRATVFMEQAYRSRWAGCRINSTQALSWPRYNVMVDGWTVASDAVPTDIANACADLALRALSEDLNADLTRGIIREKVGPIETEYDRLTPQSKRFPAIEMALAPYLKGSAANVSLVRA